MKQFLLFSVLVAFSVTLGAQDTLYVDLNATGSADGSSWANAYTQLQPALDAAQMDDRVWVAAGRYVTPTDSSFFIDRGIVLQGGFNGTETDSTAADPNTNVTILSGDVLDNDPADRYDSTLAVDNNRVLTVIDTAMESSFVVVIDGFTIRDGAIAENFQTGDDLSDFAGGGLYTEAQVLVRRTRFTANRADFGAATCTFTPSAGGSLYDEITTEGNYHEIFNAHFFASLNTIVFINSTFIGEGDTEMTSGMLRGEAMFNPFVIDCTFRDINIAATRGGALRTFDVLGQFVTGCTFDNIDADLGAALYFANDTNFIVDREVDFRDVIVDSCSFTNMISDRWGGAIFAANTSHGVFNSTFTDGSGGTLQAGDDVEGLGGVIYAQNTDDLVYQYRIVGNTFEGNESRNLGGSIFYFADQMDVGIVSNEFTNNISSEDSGGGVSIQGDPDRDTGFVQIVDNIFTGNIAQGLGGGAFDSRFVDTRAELNVFDDNQAENGSVFVAGGADFLFRNNLFENGGNATSTTFARGGGIATFMAPADTLADGTIIDPTRILVDSCAFTNNVAAQDDFISGGAAIYASGGEGEVKPSLIVANSVFQNNAVVGGDGVGGGAISIVNGVEVSILNSDFLANTSTGVGGAINVTRTTIADPNGGEADRIYNVDNEPTFEVERVLFVNNNAGGQGGAINIFSTGIVMENSVLVGNSVSNGFGSGGAVIINGSDVPNAAPVSTLVNNTFYNNLDGNRLGDNMTPPAAGNSVALFQPGSADPATNFLQLTIQNNAFFLDAQLEENIGIELNVGDPNDPDGFGAVTVSSEGGNYFSSEQPDLPVITGDTENNIINSTINIEDVFVDPFEDDPDSQFPNVAPTETSPLIDAGTTGPLVPPNDFLGLLRDDMPDIGAYEVNGVVSVAEPIEESGLNVSFYPNPTVDVLNIDNREAGLSQFMVLLSDMQGRYLAGRRFGSALNTFDISFLPAGIYNLTLLIEGKAYAKQIVKQ